jgi:hypothetical protein
LHGRINVRQPGKHRRAGFRRHLGDGHASGLARGIGPDHARFAFDAARWIDRDAEAQLFANGNAIHQVEAHSTLGNITNHPAVFAAELEVHELRKFASPVPASFPVLWCGHGRPLLPTILTPVLTIFG